MDQRSDRTLRQKMGLQRRGGDLLAGLGGHPLRLSTYDSDCVYVWDGDVPVTSCPRCTDAAVVPRSVGRFLADGPAALRLALQLAQPEYSGSEEHHHLPATTTGPPVAASSNDRAEIAGVIMTHQLTTRGGAAYCRAPHCRWSNCENRDVPPERSHAQHVADLIVQELLS